MGIVTPLDFAAYLDAAIARNVEEFTLGDLAVKFARAAGPVVDERERKEPDAPLTALEMLGRTPAVSGADTFMMPGDKPTDAATPSGWATDDPSKE